MLMDPALTFPDRNHRSVHLSIRPQIVSGPSNSTMFAFASFCSLLLIDAYGFEGISIRGRGSPFGRKVRDADGRQSMTRIWGVRCEDKFYQLEEREDAECAKTELFLRTDRSIEFGKTDGPLTKEQAGTWEVEPGTNNFRMRVRRKFTTGAEGTDMGEFDFEVIREYTGEMKLVGESVGITGTMINKDDILGDSGMFGILVVGPRERELREPDAL